jgi:hypothetical protein
MYLIHTIYTYFHHDGHGHVMEHFDDLNEYTHTHNKEKNANTLSHTQTHTMMVIEHLHDLNEFEVFLARLDVA